MPARPSPAVAVALLAAVSAAPYLRGGPVWDDHSLIFGALVSLDPAGVAALWTQPVGGAAGGGYYRPLALTTLALVGRLGPMALHGVALLAHTASATLLLRLLRPAPAAVWGAALFAVHPLASEVLGWSSALPDALAVCLGLAGAWVARRGLLAAFALTLAALLCKETALLVLPFALVAGRAPQRAWGAWGLAAVAAGGMRLIAGATAATGVAGKAALAAPAVLWTLGSTLLPHPITAVRDLRALPADAVPVGLGAVVLLVGVAAWRAPRERLAWAGLGLLVLAPVIALPTTLAGYLAAERYVYVGLIGLGAWAAAVLPASPGPSRVGLAGAATLAVVLHARLAAPWTDDRALFGHATQALPESAYAWHFLGEAEAMRGDFDAAAVAFAAALERDHPHPLDGERLLQALVLAGDGEGAWVHAQRLPQDGLTGEGVAWRARAARDAGAIPAARQLVELLRKPDGWDGPDWVPQLAQDIGADGHP